MLLTLSCRPDLSVMVGDRHGQDCRLACRAALGCGDSWPRWLQQSATAEEAPRRPSQPLTAHLEPKGPRSPPAPKKTGEREGRRLDPPAGWGLAGRICPPRPAAASPVPRSLSALAKGRQPRGAAD